MQILSSKIYKPEVIFNCEMRLLITYLTTENLLTVLVVFCPFITGSGERTGGAVKEINVSSCCTAAAAAAAAAAASATPMTSVSQRA